MAKSREDVLKIVREFREQLTALYCERLKGVYLYGSYARGEATEDSDIDVAVVLAGPLNAYAESERTADLFGGISLREGCVLIPFFLTEDEYRQRSSAVHRNIARGNTSAV
ncbi:MAG TPA: nucleotidyltransferase domain-containing protein [Planctomycetota bacterium]|nr:nucleotidyltransferase domain-containing protein [Planctomycetota bacterium]